MKVACLGSVRVVFADGGRVAARNDYYAFGKRVTNSLLPASADNLNRHLFNGKERQVVGAPGFLDYGARMYDGEIGRWMTPDPLAEKYYPVSPYNYANNNPVRYIDPDGRTILAYSVSDPQAGAYKWRDYNGTWGFYDDRNTMYSGSDAFMLRLADALTKLMNIGQTGHDLVSGLANHSNAVRVTQSNKSRVDQCNRLGWNSTGVKDDDTLEQVPTTDGMRSDPVMTLGHEMAHVEYNWNDGERKTWFRIPESDRKYKEVSISDIHATHRENQLRSEGGLPLRTHYGLDASGYGYGPRIIVPKTRASRYYNPQGITDYHPLKKGVAPYIY